MGKSNTQATCAPLLSDKFGGSLGDSLPDELVLLTNSYLFPVSRQTCAGLEQYAIDKFAESLEVIPRILAENGGLKLTELISYFKAAHQGGDKNAGFDNGV